jgi:MFS family permease
MVAVALLWPLPFAITPALVPVALVAFGLVSGAIPATVFAAIPEVMTDPRVTGMGMGAIMLGQNLAGVLGPPAFGYAVTATGWMGAAVASAALTLVGALVGWRARVR